MPCSDTRPTGEAPQFGVRPINGAWSSLDARLRTSWCYCSPGFSPIKSPRHLILVGPPIAAALVQAGVTLVLLTGHATVLVLAGLAALAAHQCVDCES